MEINIIILIVVGVFCILALFVIGYLKLSRRYLGKGNNNESKNIPEKSKSIIGGFVKEKTNPISNNNEVSRVILGRGASAEVVIGVNLFTQRQYAIKVVDATKHDVAWRYEREKNIMKDIDHANVVRLFEVYKNDSALYFVMELCTGGHLGQVLRTKAEGRLDMDTAKRF